MNDGDVTPAELERRIGATTEQAMRITRRLAGQSEHDPASLDRLISSLSQDYQHILSAMILLVQRQKVGG